MRTYSRFDSRRALTSPSRLPRATAKPRRALPALEALEGRLVLSSLTVTSPLDPATPTPGTLRYAINQADTDGARGVGDTITFAPALTGATILLERGHLELSSPDETDIWGAGITVSSQGDDVFQVGTGARAYLNGLTIANGAAINANGGGIASAGTMTIYACTFSGDSATGSSGMGGAIYNTGTLNVAYPSTFLNNSAAYGGGIVNGPGGVASVVNSTFSGNHAQFGGGAVDNNGAMTIAGSTLSRNSGQFGGAVWNAGGTLTLNTCTLAGNTATGSSTTGEGGAVFNSGLLTLSASTVAGNSAAYGGGIAIVAPNKPTFDNTIVARNTLTSIAGADPDVLGVAAAASDDNLIGNGTGLSGLSNGVNHNQVGTGSVPIDPKLGPLGSNGGTPQAMVLLPGSPAISAGGSLTTLTSAISATATVIPVADAAAIASTAGLGGWGIRVDNEFLLVTNVNLTNNMLTVAGRSPGGLFPAALHKAGAGVYFAGYGDLRSTTAVGAFQPVAGQAVSLIVSGPTILGEIAGTPFNVTVTAVDAFGKVVTGDDISNT